MAEVGLPDSVAAAVKRNTVNELSEWEFQRWFGTVEPLSLPGVRALFEGAPFTVMAWLDVTMFTTSGLTGRHVISRKSPFCMRVL